MPRVRTKPLWKKSISIVRNIHTSENVSIDSNIRSYNEIPTDRSWIPATIRLMADGGPNYLHEHCDKLHRKLGPIFRESLGSKELVFIADTKLIQVVMANEGHHPQHSVPDSWHFYNELNKVQRGIFFQVGEPWEKLRRAFNKVMLADPAKITRFSSNIVDINSDLLNIWRERKRPNEVCSEIDDVRPDLCKWSIETTGSILFGNRMGCIPRNSTGENFEESKAEKLVRNVSAMFDETSRLQIIPVRIAHSLKLAVWRRFESASARMLELANESAEQNLVRIKQSSDNTSLIKDLIDLKSLSDEEITRSVVDLIIAAADTTSNSLQWMLYLLSKHPESQEKILDEVSFLFESNEGVNNINNIREIAPYLVSFVQEALRLYPTAPFLARTLQKDIVLSNYQIPKGTPIVFSLYTTSRMEQYFVEPLEFNPSRWLRTGDRESDILRRSKQAYASLPFGLGARMCIGRRAAELEMYLFLASLVYKFKCRPNKPDDIKVRLRMILCPESPIGIRLEPR